MVGRVARWSGGVLLWAAIILMLAVTFVPAFLDRVYYHGPHSDHYNGARFENFAGAVNFPVPPGAVRGNLITRFLLGRSDRPEWPDKIDVKQDKPPVRVMGNDMRVNWVGHATVLVQTAGLNILTDPFWSPYASPFPPLGPKRVAQPGIAFDDLPPVDIIVVSHNHYDHMDLATLKRLWQRDRPVIVTSLGNDTVIAGSGAKAIALDWGQKVEARGATVHVLRNHHWSSRWGRDRNRALWSAFLIETKAGNIFFAGDTGKGDAQWPLAAKAFGPIRLAIIPIGAFRFYPGQMVTDSHIGPEQAVEMFTALGAAQGLPIHWGTIRLSNEAWDTPPKMLDIFMRCHGVKPDSFRARRIGEAFMAPVQPAAPHAGEAISPQAMADCKAGSPALSALK
ncbi:MAG: hydrolase [Sphingobium sp.]|nr:hydrolase [Sphingobium sp.]